MISPDFLAAVVLLILVLDPIGNLPLVSSLLSKVDPARRRRVVLRECAIAYVILLVFMFGGQRLLVLMRLSEISLSIAGGVILFMIAIRMVFGTAKARSGIHSTRSPSLSRWPFPSSPVLRPWRRSC